MDLVAGRAYPFERRPIRHVDLLLVVAMLGLAIAGLLMVYSATRPSLVATGINPRTFLKRQVTFVGIGAVAVMAAAVFDYRFLKVYAGLVYAGSLALLVLVRTPLGTTGTSPRSRSAPAASPASGTSEARRPTSTSCPSSTPTSSSRWWGRSSGSWGPSGSSCCSGSSYGGRSGSLPWRRTRSERTWPPGSAPTSRCRPS